MKLYKWETPVLKYQLLIVSPGACPVIPIPTSLSVLPPAASDIPRTHMELSYYYYQVLFSLTTSDFSTTLSLPYLGGLQGGPPTE